METDNEMMDWGLYGMLIRRERTRAGYKRADEFTKFVRSVTGLKISRDVYYKIEQGRQTPNATQLAAINLSLYGKAFPSWLMDRLASREWIGIESRFERDGFTGDAACGGGRTIPVRMRSLRIGMNLSKAELGRRTGMQPGMIGWIEEGRFIPYDAQLEKLACALGVEDPEELVEQTEEEIG